MHTKTREVVLTIVFYCRSRYQTLRPLRASTPVSTPVARGCGSCRVCTLPITLAAGTRPLIKAVLACAQVVPHTAIRARIRDGGERSSRRYTAYAPRVFVYWGWAWGLKAEAVLRAACFYFLGPGPGPQSR